MKKILVTGSVAYDLLLTYDGSFKDAIASADLDSLSVGFVTPRFAKHHGGTGSNIAWNLALLGQAPMLVSTVGDDGTPYRELLQERGVPVEHLELQSGHATATAIIGTDNEERQILFYHPGADSVGTWPDISQDADDIGYAIVSPRDVTLMMKGLDFCKEYKIPVIFDPGQQIHAFGDDDLLRAVTGCHAVVVNEYEWSILQERLKCTEENCLLHVPMLIVTRGESGITVFDESGGLTVSSCPAEKVVNPTGAGDAFRAGLLTGLNSGWSMVDALRLGASMGSYAVEIEGTLLDDIDKDHVVARAEEEYGEKLPQL